MSAFSDYMEDKILNWMLRGTAMGTAPTNVYVSAHTGDPGETGASNEVSGNGYTRATVSTTGGFDAPTGGASQNTAAITFPTATGSWGSVSHFAVWDASTSGNCLFKGALTAAKTIGATDVLQFLAGDLDIAVA